MYCNSWSTKSTYLHFDFYFIATSGQSTSTAYACNICWDLMVIGGVPESGNVVDNGGDNWVVAHHQSRLNRSAVGGWVASSTSSSTSSTTSTSSSTSVSGWLAPPPPPACLHTQLILAKAPGNRNETNFSFSNWLLPTKSQSEANLNWEQKVAFWRISKIYRLNLKSVLATSPRAVLRGTHKSGGLW